MSEEGLTTSAIGARRPGHPSWSPSRDPSPSASGSISSGSNSSVTAIGTVGTAGGPPFPPTRRSPGPSWRRSRRVRCTDWRVEASEGPGLIGSRAPELGSSRESRGSASRGSFPISPRTRPTDRAQDSQRNRSPVRARSALRFPVAHGDAVDGSIPGTSGCRCFSAVQGVQPMPAVGRQSETGRSCRARQRMTAG